MELPPRFISGPSLRSIHTDRLPGTGIIAQAGIWIVRTASLSSGFTDLRPAHCHNLGISLLKTSLSLFSASSMPLVHIAFTRLSLLTRGFKLLNSAGIFFTTQAILVLQPTHAPKQKHLGTHIHAALNTTSILTLIAALIIIEYNKISHAGAHFESPHAVLGLITYILFVIQAIVGITQYYTPSLYGSVNNAKSIYKYHRMSGYVLLVLSFATVAAATQTGFNKATLHIKLWAVIVAALITLVGVLPRIKKQKLGF